MKILVVDAHSAQRKSLVDLLAGSERSFLEAADGREALEMLEKAGSDVVFSALALPQMAGDEFCREARKNPKYSDIPFILIADGLEKDETEIHQAMGGTFWLKKPISALDLEIALAEATAAKAGVACCAPSASGVDTEALLQCNERLIAKLEQKNSELTGARNRIAALVEGLDGIVWEGLPATGEMTYVSPQVERILGFPQERWVRDPAFFSSRIHPDDRESVLNCLSAGEPGPCMQKDFRMLDVADRTVWLRSSAAISGGGGHQRISGLMVDVTVRKQLEAQLLQAQKLEAVGRLAAGVAHDFNNLLSVIQLELGGLLGAGKSPGDVQAGLERVQDETTRAVRLTRQLLTLSRKNTPQRTQVDLNQLIDQLANMLRQLLGEDIRLELCLDPTQPQIEADPGLIEQVVLNLAVNARDAMPKGGVLAVGTFVTERGGGPLSARVELRVRDSGCGISAENLPRIFEPFFTTKPAERGTGLGLATIRSIVEQHQGTVSVDSQVGRGTTFHVWLALQAPEVEVRAEPTVAKAAAAQGLVGGHEGILLVEDQENLRELVAAILGNLGYRVFEAGNGGDALDLWHRHPKEISLLFTDMVLPDGMTGGELAAALLGEKADLHVLLTSGHGFAELAEDADLPTDLHFLQKPFTKAILGDAVRRCLDA